MPQKRYSGASSARKTGRRIKGKAAKGPVNLDYLKPPKFRDYMTLGEAALTLQRDPRWLTRLEAAGRIPKATRVEHGKLSYRLWSPAQIEEIRTILKGHKPGRPVGS